MKSHPDRLVFCAGGEKLAIRAKTDTPNVEIANGTRTFVVQNTIVVVKSDNLLSLSTSEQDSPNLLSGLRVVDLSCSITPSCKIFPVCGKPHAANDTEGTVRIHVYSNDPINAPLVTECLDKIDV